MTASNNNNNNKSTQPGPSLNVYKKIAIIRKPNDSLTYEDAEGKTKSVSAEQLGDAITASTAAPSAKKTTQDIPVPEIRPVRGYETDISATFCVPLSYVRWAVPREFALEYVLDREDEAWWAKNSKFGGAANTKSGHAGPRLSKELLETMIDILEKETGFDSIITTKMACEIFAVKIPQLFELFPTKSQQQQQQNASGNNNSTTTTTVTAKQVISDIYNYWMHKRSRLKRPLFRRFWPVTSTEDTNPHLVFRPREKEKYKLRKKRQNDMESYRKMKQLRQDFDTARSILKLIRHREQAGRLQLQLQIELHRQQLFELLDTSGIRARQVAATTNQTAASSTRIGLNKTSIQQILAVPHVFDIHGSQQQQQQRGSAKGRQPSRSNSAVPMDLAAASASLAKAPETTTTAADTGLVAAGQNNGLPAPHFLQPLPTRQAYVTSWAGAVPHVTSYQANNDNIGDNSKGGSTVPTAKPTLYFRHRPRVGRGGRICIDRWPSENQQPTTTYFTASKGLVNSSSLATTTTSQQQSSSARLLDLLPRPLDTEQASRRIEELCVASIYEDHHQALAAAAAAAEQKEEASPANDGDEVVVRAAAWMDTDDHLWGEERHSLGPV